MDSRANKCCQNEPRHQLMFVIDVADRRNAGLLEVCFELQEGESSRTLTKHGCKSRTSCAASIGRFVQARPRCWPSVRNRGIHGNQMRNGSAIKGGDAYEVNASAFSRHGPRGGHHVIFVVFTGSRPQPHAKLFHSVHQSRSNTFRPHGRRRCLGWVPCRPHGFKEQTQGIEVGGQGALDIGFAAKTTKQTVSCGVGGQPLMVLFARSNRGTPTSSVIMLLLTSKATIISIPSILLLAMAAHLEVKPGDEQCPHRQTKGGIPSWQENAIAWKHTVDAAGIGQGLDGFLSPPQVTNHDQSHQGRHQQERHKLHSM